MTYEEFQSDRITKAQRKAMLELHEGSGERWEEFLEMAVLPTVLCPYVSIIGFHGMFVGIEEDGYTHT